MSYANLKKQLREKNFSSVYLFYGEEEYMKKYYLKKFKASIIDETMGDFNYSVFEGKNINISRVIDTIESFPVMAPHKMIIIKNSGIFKSANDSQKKFWGELIADLPSYVCLIFDENEIDKRGHLYKTVKKQGICFDFEYLKTSDLVAWIGRMFAEHNKKIENKDILYLIEHCDTGMESIENEINKLIDYSYHKDKIEKNDIEKVCTRSIESKIFDFMDGVNEGNAQKAFRALRDMLILKEQVVKILFLLAKNFSGILKTKLLLKNKVPSGNIAKELGVHPFVGQKYVRYSSNYTLNSLNKIINDCAQIDHSIKRGKINNEIGLELFAVNCIQAIQK